MASLSGLDGQQDAAGHRFVRRWRHASRFHLRQDHSNHVLDMGQGLFARFADRWAATAAALGWGPADLWGCHREKPYERLDCAGLLWLLNGAEIVTLTADTATIRTQTGAIQSFRRRPAPTGTVLAWELDRR